MEYTRHFQEMLKERAIRDSWVETALSDPEKIEDREDGTKHYLRKIPEHGNRWLRVVISTKDKSRKAITVFFDRRMREKS